VQATSDPAELTLGVDGFSYADLFDAARLGDLTARFDASFLAADPAAHARFEAYKACGGEGMKPEEVSDVLLAAAPHLSRFVARLFGVEREVEALVKGASGIRSGSSRRSSPRSACLRRGQGRRGSTHRSRPRTRRAARLSRWARTRPTSTADPTTKS
jgi:hypothetical protein